MPKAGSDFSKKRFLTLGLAYNTYLRQRDREAGGAAAVAPRDRFAQIWGWKRKKVAKPGE